MKNKKNNHGSFQEKILKEIITIKPLDKIREILKAFQKKDTKISYFIIDENSEFGKILKEELQSFYFNANQDFSSLYGVPITFKNFTYLEKEDGNCLLYDVERNGKSVLNGGIINEKYLPENFKKRLLRAEYGGITVNDLLQEAISLTKKEILKMIDNISDWKNPEETWRGEKRLWEFREELKKQIEEMQ